MIAAFHKQPLVHLNILTLMGAIGDETCLIESSPNYLNLFSSQNVFVIAYERLSFTS
jgi:hypothetical protein